MTIKIDWLSFSLPVGLSAPNDEAYVVAIEYAVQDALGKWLSDALFGGRWELQDKGRQPYSHVWKRPDCPVVMFTHPDLNHMTVEASGTACDWLREKDLLDVLMEHVSERLTRMDLAVDLKTATSPIQFCDSGYSERFTSKGVYTSDTGTTVYVGSQKSDKFCRVYRYAPPHPRSDLLRVEYVLRRDQAKAVARELSHSSLASVAAYLGSSFGWKSTDWSLRDTEPAPISLVRGDRSNSNTVRWLMTSVAPAFKRLVASGEIRDGEKFLRSYFLGES